MSLLVQPKPSWKNRNRIELRCLIKKGMDGLPEDLGRSTEEKKSNNTELKVFFACEKGMII
jgi:hypothetical protein